MAKRKRSKINNKKTKKVLGQEESGLKRSVLQEILAIVLITIGVFIILAFVGVAGNLGNWVLDAIGFLIGRSVLGVPLALFAVAFMLFAQEKYPLRAYNIVGIISFFICLSTILQATLAPNSALDISTIGSYGGVVGYGVYALVSPVLTRWVLVFIFSMLMVISVIVALNARLKNIIGKLLSPIRKNKSGDDDTENSGFKINNLPIRGHIGKNEPESKPEPEAIVAESDQDWKYPPHSLVEAMTTQGDPGNPKVRSDIIKGVFDSFGYQVVMKNLDIGPTVSQYSLVPPAGVKLSKFKELDHNLALALEADQISIEAPIPGKSLVGVQVPNVTSALVRLRDILESEEVKAEKSKLSFVLGRDVGGKIVLNDLASAPHLLIAGATNSGKSVMIHTLLLSLLYRNSPSELKLILIDPKGGVELRPYDSIPHLLAPPIDEPVQAISALQWASAEVERRQKKMREAGVKNIAEYNKHKGIDKMPYIVIVIDELANLMLDAPKDIERLISRLAAIARASGIHLVLATQRPSVNIVTGTIKANIPTRIALTTTQRVDSQTIIDAPGAEKLLGKGDMILMSPSFIKPLRLQGAFVSHDEVKGVVNFLKAQREPQYNEEVLAQAVRIKGFSSSLPSGDGYDDDELYPRALELIIQQNKASTSLLQLHLKIGYPRAASIMLLLEERGAITPADGAKPRKVLVDSIEQGSGGDSEPE